MTNAPTRDEMIEWLNLCMKVYTKDWPTCGDTSAYQILNGIIAELRSPRVPSDFYDRYDKIRSNARSAWQCMIARCFDDTNPNYYKYGDRGIRVCDRWMMYKNFVADMGIMPKGASLDRIDVNGNYEFSNCRWADAKTQMRNKRNNRIIEYNGLSMTMADWADHTGINYATIKKRLSLGFPIEEVFTHSHRTKRKIAAAEGKAR